MTKTKIEDEFPARYLDSGKLGKTGGAKKDAFALHMLVLVKAVAIREDGRVPESVVIDAARSLDIRKRPEVVARLVDAGLWETLPQGGFQLDWTHQDSAEEVEIRLDKGAQRQRAFQRRRVLCGSGDHSECEGTNRDCQRRSKTKDTASPDDRAEGQPSKQHRAPRTEHVPPVASIEPIEAATETESALRFLSQETDQLISDAKARTVALRNIKPTIAEMRVHEIECQRTAAECLSYAAKGRRLTLKLEPYAYEHYYKPFAAGDADMTVSGEMLRAAAIADRAACLVARHFDGEYDTDADETWPAVVHFDSAEDAEDAEQWLDDNRDRWVEWVWTHGLAEKWDKIEAEVDRRVEAADNANAVAPVMDTPCFTGSHDGTALVIDVTDRDTLTSGAYRLASNTVISLAMDYSVELERDSDGALVWPVRLPITADRTGPALTFLNETVAVVISSQMTTA